MSWDSLACGAPGRGLRAVARGPPDVRPRSRGGARVSAPVSTGRAGTGWDRAGRSGTDYGLSLLLRRHAAECGETVRDGRKAAHNPEVEGSNPSPATTGRPTDSVGLPHFTGPAPAAGGSARALAELASEVGDGCAAAGLVASLAHGGERGERGAEPGVPLDRAGLHDDVRVGAHRVGDHRSAPVRASLCPHHRAAC